MESITIKVSDDMAKEIEKAMCPNYSTKTEFIRDSIRDKLENIKKSESYKELSQFLGKAEKSDNDIERVRDFVVKNLAKMKGWD